MQQQLLLPSETDRSRRAKEYLRSKLVYPFEILRIERRAATITHPIYKRAVISLVGEKEYHEQREARSLKFETSLTLKELPDTEEFKDAIAYFWACCANEIDLPEMLTLEQELREIRDRFRVYWSLYECNWQQCLLLLQDYPDELCLENINRAKQELKRRDRAKTIA